MKIRIESYNEDWVRQFAKIRDELFFLLKIFNPKIEHFGSTSVPGLAAKPVIDILVGVQDVNKFDLLAENILESNNFIYLKAFNKLVPNRRMFVKLKDEINTEEFEEIYTKLEDIPHDRINCVRIAHVHVWEYESDDWIRHIAFREYLKFHDDVKLSYGNLKKELSRKDWRNGLEYNEGKDMFLKVEEKKAISWYLKTNKNKNYG